MIPMQHRSLQWDFAWRIFFAAALFWVGMTIYPAAMGSEVYGAWAQTFEAEAWAGGYMGGSLLVIYGIHINGRWRWSPFLRIAGYSVLLALFAALAASSFFAPTGVVIWAFTVPCFIYPCYRYLRENVSDAVVRWQYGRE